MTCSECCLWLVEFLLQSERITDPHNFDEDEDEDPGHGNGGINGPAAPPTKPQSDDANANVPSIDTAALGKKEGGEEEGIKEFKRERMKQLFNKHGFNLAVFPGGSVKGADRKMYFLTSSYCQYYLLWPDLTRETAWTQTHKSKHFSF